MENKTINPQNDNMRIYNSGRTVPQDAQKPFKASFGKTLTDINPMWRLMKLTELFGPVGLGWYVEVTRQDTHQLSNGETCVFTDVDLYVRDPESGEWSKPIHGTGGNRLVVSGRDGLMLDDEAYKKAYTDAVGIACKALGIGADVYWQRDESKYAEGTATITRPSEAVREATPIVEQTQSTPEVEVKQPETKAARAVSISKIMEDNRKAIEQSPVNKETASPRRVVTTPETPTDPTAKPRLSPSSKRWDAFIVYLSKLKAEVPREAIVAKMRETWELSDEDYDTAAKIAGRAA